MKGSKLDEGAPCRARTVLQIDKVFRRRSKALGFDRMHGGSFRRRPDPSVARRGDGA